VSSDSIPGSRVLAQARELGQLLKPSPTDCITRNRATQNGGIAKRLSAASPFMHSGGQAECSLDCAVSAVVAIRAMSTSYTRPRP
jgi:hypothetical protein